MREKEMTCIVCPIGCQLKVVQDDGGVSVSGHTCPKGKTYGVAEMTDPRRMVTFSVAVDGGQMPLVSVKTQQPIAKDRMFDVVAELRKLRLKAPIEIGDTILHNVAGTDVDIVATRQIRCV